jgi:hypothetical protein
VTPVEHRGSFMRLLKCSSVPFLLALIVGLASPALTDEACLDFKWDVSKERALFADLLTLKIPAPGSYRIAGDLPFWIDVVSNGDLVAAKDYQGQHACSAPHKIVEFDLVGVQPFVVQISNAATDSVLLTVTPSPVRKF